MYIYIVLHLNVYLQAAGALPRAQSKQARLSVAHLAPFWPDHPKL